jgi:hypothetical protein
MHADPGVEGAMTTICSTDQPWGPVAAPGALAETGPAAVARLRPTRPDKSGPGDGTLIGADQPLAHSVASAAVARP